jgi:hypothetical protein
VVQVDRERGETRVTPDLTIARRLLEDAGRHLATASQAKAAGDPSGAYQLAYDALRKSAASLLEAQGLRATSRGRAPSGPGSRHRAVRDDGACIPLVWEDSPGTE